eukprot:10703202-Heterocapsa_arctica.AAC.1
MECCLMVETIALGANSTATSCISVRSRKLPLERQRSDLTIDMKAVVCGYNMNARDFKSNATSRQ